MKTKECYAVIVNGALVKVPLAITEEKQIGFMIRRGIRYDRARIYAQDISKFKRHRESSET